MIIYIPVFEPIHDSCTSYSFSFDDAFITRDAAINRAFEIANSRFLTPDGSDYSIANVDDGFEVSVDGYPFARIVVLKRTLIGNAIEALASIEDD